MRFSTLTARMTLASLLAADIDGAPVHTKARAQAGLFDVALHPDFASNRQVFISYAAKVSEDLNTLVVRRFTYSEDGKLDAGKQVFAANPPRKESHHYGGRIIFPGDGTFMIPHGEGYNHRERAQTLDNQMVRSMRMNMARWAAMKLISFSPV